MATNEATEECLHVAEQYQWGLVSQTRDSREISKILLATLSEEDGTGHVNNALASYLQMLAGLDAEQDGQEHQTNNPLPGVQLGSTRAGQADDTSPISQRESGWRKGSLS